MFIGSNFYRDSRNPLRDEEQERQQRLVKHGIDPKKFEVFLSALAKRYEGRSFDSPVARRIEEARHVASP